MRNMLISFICAAFIFPVIAKPDSRMITMQSCMATMSQEMTRDKSLKICQCLSEKVSYAVDLKIEDLPEHEQMVALKSVTTSCTEMINFNDLST